MTSEAPAAVNELAAWGCPFARTGDGKLDQRYFGAHTYRRTCYPGDYTGRAVLSPELYDEILRIWTFPPSNHASSTDSCLVGLG